MVIVTELDSKYSGRDHKSFGAIGEPLDRNLPKIAATPCSAACALYQPLAHYLGGRRHPWGSPVDPLSDDRALRAASADSPSGSDNASPSRCGRSNAARRVADASTAIG